MPDTTQTHDAFYRQTVTYRGSGIDFDLLWPRLDDAWLAKLAAQLERWKAAQAMREQQGRLE